MAKGFSEKEKEIIKDKLKKTGIDLFGSLGIKKTNIEDLTKAAGIARGSFYLFYDSKEDFFMELLDEAEHKIKSDLISIISNSVGSKHEIVKSFLREYIYSILETNPILKILINHSDEFETLLRKLPEGRLQSHTQNDRKSMSEFIRSFNDKGITLNKSEEVLTGIFRGLIFMSMHKSVIGDAIFPSVIDAITEGLALSIVK